MPGLPHRCERPRPRAPEQSHDGGHASDRAEREHERVSPGEGTQVGHAHVRVRGRIERYGGELSRSLLAWGKESHREGRRLALLAHGEKGYLVEQVDQRLGGFITVICGRGLLVACPRRCIQEQVLKAGSEGFGVGDVRVSSRSAPAALRRSGRAPSLAGCCRRAPPPRGCCIWWPRGGGAPTSSGRLAPASPRVCRTAAGPRAGAVLNGQEWLGERTTRTDSSDPRRVLDLLVTPRVLSCCRARQVAVPLVRLPPLAAGLCQQASAAGHSDVVHQVHHVGGES